MSETMTVFVVGLSGVFVGISFLYLAIRLTSLVTDKIQTRKEP
jgi:hypothetical protein